MVVVGVDAHERTHTLVAIDEAGRKLAGKSVAATADGHLEAVVGPVLARARLCARGLPLPHPWLRAGPSRRRRGGCAGCRPA
jgi:hypothetical protein